MSARSSSSSRIGHFFHRANLAMSRRMSELLQWDNYSDCLLIGLRSLLENDLLCDLSIVADNQTIRVHRTVLAATSDYFRALLTTDMKEKGTQQVVLKGVPIRGLREVVTFAYTGQLHCTYDNIQDVLIAATHLQFVEAVHLCSQYLTNLANLGNCIDMYNMAEQFGLSQLQEKAFALILNNFEEIAEQGEFLTFCDKFLCRLLADNRLKVANELCLFELVLRWLKHDTDERIQHAGRLMQRVRFPLIPPEDLADRVMTDVTMKTNPECLELILEANRYHMLPDKQPLLQNARTRVRSNTSTIFMLDIDEEGPKVFDLATRSWGALQGDVHNSIETFHAQICVIDNFLFVCGGIELYSSNNPVSAKCYRYDPRFNSWSEISSMKEPRYHFTLVSDGRSMFAIGGYCSGVFKNVMEQYSVTGDCWEKKAPLDVKLSSAAAAVHSGKIYLAGGQTHRGISRNLWGYDPVSDCWCEKSNMLMARMDHTMVCFANRLFAIGGYNKDIVKAYDVNTVECYEVETDQWSVVCENTPKISGITSCLVEHQVYVVGGFTYDENRKRNEVWCYDIKKNDWQVVTKIAVPAMSVPCCALVMPRQVLPPAGRTIPCRPSPPLYGVPPDIRHGAVMSRSVSMCGT